jgi:hypothetical protein
MEAAVNKAARTLIQEVWCEHPDCKQVIMRIWRFQGRRQCENVSCPCDNALADALHAALAQRPAKRP